MCDDIDDCPDDYDPGQLDLDHDGHGWVCEAVEHVDAVAPAPFVLAARGMLHGPAMSAVLHRGDGIDEFVGASPAGGGVASRATDDAWASGVSMRTPMVSPAGDLLVDVDDGNAAGVGLYDGATHTFHGKATGFVNSYGMANGAVAVIEVERDDGGSEIVAPEGNGLTSLAMRGRPVNVGYGAQLAPAGAPPSFSRTSGSARRRRRSICRSCIARSRRFPMR